MTSGRCYLTAISFHANSNDFDYQLYSICHQFQVDKMHLFLHPLHYVKWPVILALCITSRRRRPTLPFFEKWKKAMIFRKMSCLCPSISLFILQCLEMKCLSKWPYSKEISPALKKSWLHASSSKSTDKSTKLRKVVKSTDN